MNCCPSGIPLFTKLGFQVVVSPFSSRKLYQSGTGHHSPVDTACFPAKLSHGHIHWLAEQGVDAVFYPCMSYNLDEHLGDNHYNCPVVAYYPEVLEGNCPELTKIPLLYDYFNLERRKDFYKRFYQSITKTYPRPAGEGCPCRHRRRLSTSTPATCSRSVDKGTAIIAEARKEGQTHHRAGGAVPTTLTPRSTTGIDQLIIRQGAAVVTEDSVSWHEEKIQHLGAEPVDLPQPALRRRQVLASTSPTWTWSSWFPSAAVWTPSPPTRPARSCRPAASCTPS